MGKRSRRAFSHSASSSSRSRHSSPPSSSTSASRLRRVRPRGDADEADGRGGGGRFERAFREADLLSKADEVDEFALQRDFLSVTKGEEEEEEEREEEEEEEGEEEEEEKEDLHFVGVPADDDEEEAALESLRRRENLLSTALGHDKRLYYDTDVHDLDVVGESELQEAEEEEKEALRLRALRDAARSEVEEDNSLAELLLMSKEHRQLARDRAKRRMETSQEAGKSQNFGAPEMEAEEIEDEAEENGEAFGTITRDESAISDVHKLRVLKRAHPELFVLPEALQSDLRKWQRLDRLRRSPLVVRQVRSYVEERHALLGSMISLTLSWLALIASDVDMKEHPLPVSLLEVKRLLQDMKSLESVFEPILDGIVADKFAKEDVVHLLAQHQAHVNRPQQQRTTEEFKELDDTGHAVIGHDKYEEAESEEVKVFREDRDNACASDDDISSSECEDTSSRIEESKVDTNLKSNTKESFPTAEDLFGVSSIPSNSKTIESLRAVIQQRKVVNNSPKIGHVDVEEDDHDDFEDYNTQHLVQTLKHQSQVKSQARAMKRLLIQSRQVAPETMKIGSLPLLDPDSKRKITRSISKNEGLKVNRPKDRKTPKTRNRARYEKALVKRSSQVRTYKESVSEGYGGEHTGINVNVTKSVRLHG